MGRGFRRLWLLAQSLTTGDAIRSPRSAGALGSGLGPIGWFFFGDVVNRAGDGAHSPAQGTFPRTGMASGKDRPLHHKALGDPA